MDALARAGAARSRRVPQNRGFRRREHLEPLRGACGEKPVEQGRRLCRGGRFIVEVACEDQRIDVEACSLLDDAPQGVPLVVEQGISVDVFADVKIGEVHELHGLSRGYGGDRSP